MWALNVDEVQKREIIIQYIEDEITQCYFTLSKMLGEITDTKSADDTAFKVLRISYIANNLDLQVSLLMLQLPKVEKEMWVKLHKERIDSNELIKVKAEVRLRKNGYYNSMKLLSALH